ncbi:MAG TPA: tetratricopeptide repeat protein [Nitrospira sp.]|nr:tetratricopeptide repeat protein [Nitrospira sp.]
MRTDKRASQKTDKKAPGRAHKRGVVGYSKKSALLEEAITHMNAGKYGRSSAALKELLALDPHNTEARRLFATLHLKLGSLVTARQAFESLANEATGRQDYWLAESLLREYLAAGPRCVPFLELLAHVYQEKGDDMAAVGELGKAIEILRDDPDAENPQKAAQLYTKIRELAPASSVAFQLASLFDVQTGEFLVRPSIGEPPVPTNEDSGPSQNSAFPIAVESPAPEIMPWEQAEESSPAEEARASSDTISVDSSERSESDGFSAPDETQEHGLATEAQALSIASEEPPSHEQDLTVSQPESEIRPNESTLSLSAPVELTVEVPKTPERCDHVLPDSHTLLPVTSEPEVQGIESAQIAEALSESETGSAKGIPSRMPWEQVADSSVEIPEPEPPSMPDPVSCPESVFSSLGTESQTSVPAPMPWEHVADATLQIAETEASPAPSPVAFAKSMLPTLREDAVDSSPPLSPSLNLSQAEEPTAAPTALDTPSILEEIPLNAEQPEPASSSLSAEETPRSSSFLWNSVFDKAWKFAAGTTSPSTSVPSEKPQEDSSAVQQAEQNCEPESWNLSPAPPEAPTSPSIEQLSTFEPASSGQAVSASEQPREFLAESISCKGESFAVESSPAISVAPDVASSYPDQIESGTADLPAYSGAMPSEGEAPSPVPPAMPASFSTVVEEQSIPEVEPAPMEPSESEDQFGLVSPDHSPLAVAPEPSGIEKQPDAEELLRAGAATPIVSDPPLKVETTTPLAGAPSHWSTGEVAVQLHRPTAKKKKWEKEPQEVAELPATPPPPPALESLSEKFSEALREWESTPTEAAPPPVVEKIVPPQEDERPDWMQASDAITFTRPATPAPKTEKESEVASHHDDSEPVPSAAASAVDVLFSSSASGSHVRTHEPPSWSRPRPRFVARLHRVRIGVSSFIDSCLSTTRSLTFLALAIGVMTVLVATIGVGALGLAWMVMEDPPSALYQSLTINPPRVVTDPKKNGYLLLLGFDAPAGKDPVQAGYERKAEEHDAAAAHVCMGGDDAKDGASSGGASAHVVKGWFRSGDPVGQLKGQGDTVRSLAVRESSSLARYQQWLTMPFDDWGYGQPLSPNCTHILLAHRLFLLEGFNQDSAVGLDRLETDLRAWRAALGQSKTLMMKMLALTAVQDDVSMASGLLSRSELDGSSLTRLSKMVRPLDQVELSVRWPMQSHLVLATKSVAADLRQDQSSDRPWYVSMVAAMRLPVQRRANAYAEYYEATNKAAAEGRYTNLPKPSSFIRTPATGVMDYLTNPIEHIVGIEPLPLWDPYIMRVIETDAQLRLAGLQAWIRRGPQEGDVLTRMAKAGQAYYDPFTGLPMLVNQRKGLIYSVGRDGKDQEGDRAYDVAVAIPSVPSSSSESRRSVTASQSR